MKKIHPYLLVEPKRIVILAVLSLLVCLHSSGQCSCTSTISTNTAVTVNAGQTVCLTFAGNYTQNINLNGGTLCVSASTHITSGTTTCTTASTVNIYGSMATALTNFNTGFTLNNYGTFTGSISQAGGTVTNYSGGIFTPSAVTFTSGSLTNNSGATVTIPNNATIGSAYTFTNNGTANISNIFISAGGIVNLNTGTQTMATANNSGTINLTGNLTITGTYIDAAGATIIENQSGCNTLTIATNHGGNGTFNGNGNGLIVNSTPASTGSMINGAMASFTAPTQQPTGLSIPLSGLTVNGSFTSPSATITGYIVLRYIGAAAPSDNPVNYSNYSVGSTIGSSTVVAIVNGGSTGTMTFTDNLPSGHCGQNVYYRIFSFMGVGDCETFDLTSPLTGSVAIANPVASVSQSGPLSVCLGDLTLTATGGGTYLWSDGETTAAITPVISLVYTVTVTNASGCTVSAGGLSVNITLLPSSSINSATVCPGTPTTLSATGGLLNTYRWSTGSVSPSITVSPSVTTTYTCTVTEILGLGCSVAVSGTVTVPIPTPTVNNPSICGGAAATLTATGGTSYHWSTGAITTSISTSTPGTYTVTATNATGCTATASGTATAHTLPTPTVNSTTICTGSSATLTATGGSSYLWNTGAATTSISTSPASTTTYTVTATNAFTCSAAASGTVTVVNCLSVSGSIFDDANGNGIIDGTDAAGALGQTLYTVMSDTTGSVVASVPIAANGSFSISNVLPNTSGFRVYVSSSSPTVGSANAGYSWPSGWAGTLGQYGKNNLAGTGIDGFTGAMIPVATGAGNITGLMMGFDRLPTSSSQSYTIPYPNMNNIKKLVGATGLGALSGLDPESGLLGSGNAVAITSLAGMHGNQLFYDQNGDGVMQPFEVIAGYTMITNYDPNRLYIHFIGSGSMSASFNYNVADPGGVLGSTAATYTINWIGTLPVELEYFTAAAEGRTAMLQWATASEIGNDHFDIERSADAINWVKIGCKKGAGTTSSKTEYSMTDETPMPDANYYRLKQVDVDGRFVYTNIAAVTFESEDENKLTMYPNPLTIHAPLTIQLSNTNSTISQITIVNAMGEIVYQNANLQGNIAQIDDGALQAGAYVVSVHSDDSKSANSLLVVR